MALERSEVEKIAHLARLGLNEGDIPQTTETLNNILGLIDQMQASTPRASYPWPTRWKPPSACVPTWSTRATIATPTRPSPRPWKAACTSCRKSSNKGKGLTCIN